MGDLDSDATSHLDGEENGRREFLKKAGKIAFVVPAIQVLSMAPAGAQSNGSVVTTQPPGSTMPPTSSTSTSSTTSSTTTSSTPSSTTTTTEAPCEETIRYLVKAEWDENSRQITWVSSGGPNDCLTAHNATWDRAALGSSIGVSIDSLVVDETSGELSGARMWVGDDCYFDFAAVKAGQACQVVNLNGGITIFSNVTSPSISHFEAIVVCCEESP